VITVAQVRAARAILGWTQKTLADHAGIGIATVKTIEGGAGTRTATLAAIIAALQEAGIDFLADTGGVGARLKG
jgi:DNA-binding XRE family transcriptional regulator